MSRPAIALILLALFSTGCQGPLVRLTFPNDALKASRQPQWFDVDRNGRPDFCVSFNDEGTVDALGYDDNEDGKADRIYHLSDYANDRVPHLILLLDSVPFHCAAERYERGEFRWFSPPTKVIAPFPSLTEISFTELLHAPPMPGVTDRRYSREEKALDNALWGRLAGSFKYPWESYLHYRSKFVDEPFAYVDPRPWYQSELEHARRTLDASPDQTTLVYLASASAMACRYGRQGVDQVLDGASRLCLQLLYERRGALKISMMADHGHNLIPSHNIDVGQLLRQGGFRVVDHLEKGDDVVPELIGLVTYAGVRTTQPARVSQQLLTDDRIEFAMYQSGDSVIIRNRDGFASIDARGQKLRYRPGLDLLGYESVMRSMREAGKFDADGFASREDWFAATADEQYPDALNRVWVAFHERVVDPPDVMFTTRDGYTAGLESFRFFIKMASTHGSLNQANTATFLMTMTGRANATMPTRDVMKTIEPSYEPRVRRHVERD